MNSFIKRQIMGTKKFDVFYIYKFKEGALNVAGKKHSLFVDVAKDVLNEQGIDFAKWKKEVVLKAKMALMEGKNQQWESNVVEEAALKVVSEDLKSRRKLDDSSPEKNVDETNNLTNYDQQGDDDK